MVGKHMHKKKMSEYTENEDYKSDADAGDDDMADKEYRVSDGSENGDVDKNDIGGKSNERDDDEETTLGEDDDLAQGINNYSHGDGDDVGSPAEDNDDDYEADSAKKSKKRKTAGAKKALDTTVETDDDDALNGASPKKKGRKAGGGGKAGGAKTPAKGKAAKAKKAAPPVDEDEDDGEEEEYEVKDIVGHKTERGVSYFLIRWKGYTKADDTWEAEDSLNCPEIIEKYKKKQAATTSPKKGAAPASKKGGKKGAGAASAAKGNKNAKQQDEEEVEQEWEVDKIIDYAEEKKGRVFRIRWKGFGPKHDTWEPEANLNCKDIIDKFLKRMKADENVSFKELREEPKKTKRLVNETAPRTNIHNAIGRKSKRGNKQRVYYGEDD
ncbi:uncharacterized protein isoform X2 [Musca autumnalis]|uniref:uncharacterized protein isoform X2 n=1 Tax=Musca autumnalis TaxID=221902 RepID=UPI003CECE427